MPPCFLDRTHKLFNFSLAKTNGILKTPFEFLPGLSLLDTFSFNTTAQHSKSIMKRKFSTDATTGCLQ